MFLWLVVSVILCRDEEGKECGKIGGMVLQLRSWAVTQWFVPFLSLQCQKPFATSGVFYHSLQSSTHCCGFESLPADPRESNGKHCFFPMENTAFFQWKALLSSNGEHSIYPMENTAFIQWKTLLSSNGEHCFFPMENTFFLQWRTLFFSNGKHWFYPMEDTAFFQWKALFFPEDLCTNTKIYTATFHLIPNSFLTQGPHRFKQHPWLS